MACHKHTYPDKKAAISARHAALRPSRRHKRPEDLKVYECHRCHGWHLAKRAEADFKRTRSERGERKAAKHSRRAHNSPLIWGDSTDG